MTGGKLQVLWLTVALLAKYASTQAVTEPTEDLKEAETKDGKLEIIKQIKKVNGDGSYTIGYEADDGSFKIESRDVLGNVKGTYGFVDDDGQLKRVTYSTSNTTEIVSTPEPPSVVQRIPKLNRTIISSTTRRPFYRSATTASTPTTTVIQTIPRRRPTTASTKSTPTTEKPSYAEFIRAAAEASKATLQEPINIVYATSSPTSAHLLQGKPLLRSTVATNAQTQKSEGQIVRPEVVPSVLPLLRRLGLHNPLLEGVGKPVKEDPEVHGNVLRRQLSPDNKAFDVQGHLSDFRQSMGDDATDVYSGSVTTGTPRPLFTTSRPRILLSSTTTPAPQRIVFSTSYQRNDIPETQSSSESSRDGTTESTQYSTQAPIAAQIPASRQEPLVAIKHPLQRGTILVPISQLQTRDVQLEYTPQYVPDGQYVREVPVNDPRQVYVQRIAPPLPPHLRSMPVQVDENGYVRPIHRPPPYGVPFGPTPLPVSEDGSQDEINQIQSPVTVRDFQKLIDQLIARQRRLEQINALTRRTPVFYNPRVDPNYQPPYVIQRNPETQTGPVQFVPADLAQQRQRQYVPDNRQNQYEQPVLIRPHNLYHHQPQYNPNLAPASQTYAPSRRVARLLPRPEDQAHQEVDEEGYLPPDVREMLLLRMLQLAINPALPAEVTDAVSQETTQSPTTRKAPVRNVEILGEEAETKRPRV